MKYFNLVIGLFLLPFVAYDLSLDRPGAAALDFVLGVANIWAYHELKHRGARK